jgi:hypothetical protein
VTIWIVGRGAEIYQKTGNITQDQVRRRRSVYNARQINGETADDAVAAVD